MISRLKDIAAVAFDLDNTLYDRDAAMKAWLALVFPGKDAILRDALEQDNSGFVPRREFYSWLAARVDWANDWQDVETRYQQEALSFIVEDSAIKYALETLARCYPLGVLTNGGGFQRRKLECLRLGACFSSERVLVTREIGYDKPDVRAFARLAEVFKIPAAQILFVGDNPVNDIEGAAAAGMRTCWVRLSAYHECRVPADIVVRSVADLPVLLNAG